MKEAILHKYFLNNITAEELAIDLRNSQSKTGYDTISIQIERIIKGEFKIESKHLIKLCNAHLNGDITDLDLNTIGFTLIASDFFIWDEKTKSDQIISEVIHDWDNESIGYDINNKNVWHWKNYLENGYNNLDKEELKLKFSSKGTDLKLYQEVDKILWEEWDPIAVSELIRDEYQSYSPIIFKLRKSNKTTSEIENELYRIETQTMGLNGNRNNCKRVAKLINELKSDP